MSGHIDYVHIQVDRHFRPDEHGRGWTSGTGAKLRPDETEALLRLQETWGFGVLDAIGNALVVADQQVHSE